MQGLEQNIFQQLVTLVKKITSRNHDDGHESSTIKREFIMLVLFRFAYFNIFSKELLTWRRHSMWLDERVSKGRPTP